MNRSKELKDLGKFYENVVAERVLNEGEVVPMKSDGALGVAFEKDPSGAKLAPDMGPEAADNFKPSENDPKKVTGDDNAYNVKKNSDPQKRVSKESINNCRMSDTNTDYKSEFDKLYEFAMEADDDMAELGVDLGDDMGDEEMGDDMEGGDPVDRLRGLIDELQDILAELEGGGEEFGDEEDELGGFDDETMGDSVGEAVVSEPEPKTLGGHGDRSHPDQGKGPWSSGSGSYDGSGGTAEHGSIPEEPEPKVLGGHGDRSHKDAGNTGSGSNKVKVGKKNNPGAHALGN